MFITTANVLDTIPGPLRDRMEIIQLPGYTEEEKLRDRQALSREAPARGEWPDALSKSSITDDALRAIIGDYTREAGVRNLEREIGAVLRARRDADRRRRARADRDRCRTDLHAILGPRRFENEVAQRTAVPGVATGLAWTPVGGDILFIEASKVPGNGKLILTGQLGDVMKESAQAALTLVKARNFSWVDRVRQDRRAHPRAGGRHAQGRAERRRGDVPRPGVAAHRAAGAHRRGDDRRDLAARPGAADRRREGEDARRAARGHQAR